MRKGDKRVFDDISLLKEMLLLRKQGWSLPKLGKRYGVNHTSILYQCQKKRKRIKDIKVTKINKPKKAMCYADYLLAEKRRLTNNK